MNIFEHMDRKTAYTAQELADKMEEPLKLTETELTIQCSKGKLSFENARGYKFYFLRE